MKITPLEKSDYSKLELYKTAWSPLYKTFVGIEKVHYDVDGEPIITAIPAWSAKYILFRAHELTNYCL
jgi:hypothetical protein